MSFPFKDFQPMTTSMQESMHMNLMKDKSLLAQSVKVAGESVPGFGDMPRDKQVSILEFIGSNLQEPKRQLRNMSGEDTITDVVKQVEDALGGTNGFLKRVAKVESNYGEHPNTFNGVSNGVWQVDDIGLKDTKINTPVMIKAKEKIKNEFGIDWDAVTKKDLEDPLIGALAARLYLLRIPKEIPKDIKGQATYWKTHYNKSGKGSVSKFLSRL